MPHFLPSGMTQRGKTPTLNAGVGEDLGDGTANSHYSFARLQL